METRKIKITDIIFPAEDVAVRPKPTEKDTDWKAFLEFKADIAHRGLLSLFCVRPDGNKFVVVDGSRRATAIQMLHKEKHPDFKEDSIVVSVRDEEEYDALMSQIAGNHQHKGTLNTQEIKAIQRIAIHKGYTMETLGKMVGMNAQYLDKLLKLNALPDVAKKALDANKLTLANAMTLNKLPIEVIEKFIEDAMVKNAEDFTVQVTQQLNEIRKARQGGEKKAPEYVPTAKLLKKEELAEMFEKAKFANENTPNDYNRGCYETLAIAFQLDEKTQVAKKAEWEKKEEERKLDASKRKEKREGDKLADAKKMVEDAGGKVSGIK